MKAVFDQCTQAADAYGMKGNYVAGANIAGFTKVAEAMLAQGLV
jgi:glutamate dehydrogenase (NADP+)